MRLFFHNNGTGPALLILHGLFGSGDNWAGVAGKLADTFNVFCVDLRNHGRSPHSDAMDYSGMLDDIRELLASENLGSAHILGHSMGGRVAMHLALQHPVLVETLVVVDIAPSRQADRHSHIFRALRSLDLSSFNTRAELEAALAPDIPDLSVRRFLLKSIEKDPDGSFRWRMNLGGIQRNYSTLNEALSSVRPFLGPVLFIRGELSNYIQDGDIPELQRLFPNAGITTVEGAGHWVHAEAPDAFLQALANFYQAQGHFLPSAKRHNPEPA